MAIFELQDGKKFYQWDAKRKLIVTDNRIDQVHFTNDTLENAIVQVVYEKDGFRLVDVPTYLLEFGCNLTAYAYIARADKEYTLLHEVIGVTPRKKPDDYIPEEETYRWTTLQKEVLAAAEHAKVSEQNAQTAAENASISEQEAKTAAASIGDSKAIAESAANAALQAEETARNAADAAAVSATTAAESEQKAIEAASSAIAKAEEIAASVTAAEQSAITAGISEANATASATAAKESETSAKAAENNAKTSEDKIKGYMTSASDSAIDAANSATIAKAAELNAEGSAGSAANSATKAANSESAAKKAEANASESAATAATKATEAANNAATAVNAKDAAEAAQAAAEKARDEVTDFVGGDFATNTALNSHTNNSTVHITDAERTTWNSKAEKADIPTTLPASDVHEWAKQTEKPKYTAEEVGALPNTYTPPNQTAEQVGADPKGTAAETVTAHNVAADSHNDIRLLIEGLTTRLNALANSDDETLDQMAELVAYIKDNRELIEQVTTDKVAVADIIDNLTTNASNKPLSAAQGVALKALHDALQTSLSSHVDDGVVHITATERTKWNSKAEGDHNHDGVYAPKEHSHSQYLTEHQDISGKANVSDLTSHTGNTTVHITAAERTAWNNKSDFSGNYNDLTNKPTIPTVPVQSVNGKTGAVKLTSDDVGAAPKEHTHDQYLTEHQDISGKANVSDLTSHTGNTTVHITAAERTKWNSKSDFSGSYNDLTNKPTIPTVPTNVSAFNNDAGYLTEHQDISGKANKSDLTSHTGNTTVHITAAERTAWNNKSNFSGNYNDLTNKPTIPTVPTKVSAFTNDANYATEAYVQENILQSDWEQNDETENNYIRNRPFYETAELYLDETYQLVSGPIVFDVLPSPLETGVQYLVIFNGYTCFCTAAETVVDGATIVYLGNISLIGGEEETDYPFVITWFKTPSDVWDNAQSLIAYPDPSIEEMVVTIHKCVSVKLDEKFIPDTIARKTEVEEDLNTHTENTTVHVTAAERTAWNSKAPAYSYGTVDLTAGSSPLETGKLYFVYE